MLLFFLQCEFRISCMFFQVEVFTGNKEIILNSRAGKKSPIAFGEDISLSAGGLYPCIAEFQFPQDASRKLGFKQRLTCENNAHIFFFFFSNEQGVIFQTEKSTWLESF